MSERSRKLGLDRSLELAKQIIKRETYILSDSKPRCRECGRLMFHGEHDPDCETGVVQGLHYGILSWHNAYRRMQAEAAEQEIERLDRKGNLAFEATLIEKYLDDLDGRKGFALTPEIRRWIRREWWEIAEATLLQGGDDE